MSSTVLPAQPQAARTLAATCAAHALHDGLTDLLYVLLPVWQAEFGLGYAALGLLRSVFTGTMAGLQIPAGRLTERLGGLRGTLALGTALLGLGYALAGLSGGVAGLAAALALAGAGASTQHPAASAAIAGAYGTAARGPLGTYNFAGDLGKAAIPAAAALLLAVLPWRGVVWLLAGLALLVAVGVGLAMPAARPEPEAARSGGGGRGGFPLLLAIGVLDSATRMGLLLFLPFLLQAKGAGLPLVGTALALVFVGGAAGKFTCGWLAARIGVLRTVLLTETGTAAAILLLPALPLGPTILLLPLLGVVLNGTSSALYGSVPSLAPPGGAARAFALFYTGTIGSGAVAPVLYGALGDVVGTGWAVAAAALTALATVPLALMLGPRLREGAA